MPIEMGGKRKGQVWVFIYLIYLSMGIYNFCKSTKCNENPACRKCGCFLGVLD